MAKRSTSKKLPSKLKPRLYSEERVEKCEALNRTDRPLILGSVLAEDIEKADGWISFVLPKSTELVHLRLRTDLWHEMDSDGREVKKVSNASPNDAIREWFFVRQVNGLDSQRVFDIKALYPAWNFGSDPPIGPAACGAFHLGGTRSVSGYSIEAHQEWFKSGYQGPSPVDLHALLDPDDRLPFMTPPSSGAIPPANRWLYVGVDLASPLEEQFKVLKGRCRRLQDLAFAVAGVPRPRPKSREARRDTLIYALHYSTGLTVPEIAKRVFPREQLESAQMKVRRAIRRCNEALRKAGRQVPRFTRQSKSPT